MTIAECAHVIANSAPAGKEIQIAEQLIEELSTATYNVTQYERFKRDYEGNRGRVFEDRNSKMIKSLYRAAYQIYVYAAANGLVDAVANRLDKKFEDAAMNILMREE